MTFGSSEWIGAILLNMFWNSYNILILSVAVATAWERPQRRASPRIEELHFPATLHIQGHPIPVRVEDASMNGMRVSVTAALQLTDVKEGDTLMLNINDKNVSALNGITIPEQISIEACVVNYADNMLALSFVSLTLPQERWLDWHLFGRADAWNNPGYHPDSFFKSLTTLLRIVKNFYGDLWCNSQKLLWKKLHGPS